MATLDLADKGKALLARRLRQEHRARRDTQAHADEVLARIRPTTEYADLAGCDLVIEAVFEDRDGQGRGDQEGRGRDRRKARCSRTNTSTLPITGLAEASSAAEPVHRPALLLAGREDAAGRDHRRQEDLDRDARARHRLRAEDPQDADRGERQPRLLHAAASSAPIIERGHRMLEEGVPPAMIENAARMAGMPVGPLAVNDEVSIELSLHVQEQNAQGPRRRGQDAPRAPGQRGRRQMCRDRPHGKSAGPGFYDYPAGGKKHLWAGLVRALRRPEHAGRAMRLRGDEGTAALHGGMETIAASTRACSTGTADGNIGSLFGIGFPAWTGGVLQFVNYVGPRAFATACRRARQEARDALRPAARLLLELAEKGETFR